MIETRTEYEQAIRQQIIGRYGVTLEDLMNVQIAEWRADLGQGDWQHWTAEAEATAFITMRWQTQDSVEDAVNDLGCYLT